MIMKLYRLIMMPWWKYRFKLAIDEITDLNKVLGSMSPVDTDLDRVCSALNAAEDMRDYYTRKINNETEKD